MDIKKTLKLSFSLISILIILITFVSSVVLYHMEKNNINKNNIEKIVSLQEAMNSLSQSLLVSTTLGEIDDIKIQFIKHEKNFEATKKTFIQKNNKHFFDYFIEDIYADKKIHDNFQKLYHNEKSIEVSFDKVYDLQETKILLFKKFKKEYPLENKLRKKLANMVATSNNISLVRTFGKVEYYSKETLYQKKDTKVLQKWIDNILLVKNMNLNMNNDVDKYLVIAKKFGLHAIKIENIKKKQNKLKNDITSIIQANKKVNQIIQEDIDSVSSNFMSKVYFYTFVLLGFTIFFIITTAYSVSKNVGLSVDEIESKVEDGLSEIKALNHEIEITQQEIIFTMGAIGEHRSKETGNHVKRVAKYSKLLALLYGLSEEEAEMLKQASPMHDIGKIAIPDAVLNKPGRFNEEERKIMDTHAQLGYEMLKGSNRTLLKASAIVAREHHEKWDGSGYPQKKKAQEIHIYGRITALADVFDALGSDRVYKKAWDDERIFNLFKEERGKHFDPKLIDIFFAHLDEFLDIRNSLKD